jgi:CheY-like chemotaxis protein
MLDPNRFLQILINLITNAIKFTRGFPKRQITVHVSASKERPTGSSFTYVPGSKAIDYAVQASNSTATAELVYIQLAVSDTGKGLTDEERLVLFHRWAQASPKTHIEYGGSGLGLFISRQITELMGGQIGVSNGQKEGSTFAFFVETRRLQDEEVRRALVETNKHHGAVNLDPIIASAERIPEPVAIHGSHIHIPPSPILSQFENPDKPRVLVVEDNLVNQRVLVKQLRNRGYSVIAANNGLEALQALQDTIPSAEKISPRGFDVVLCDIEMPVMGGIDCVREIRRLEEQGVLHGHVPVIAVTANARSQHVQTALEAGMNDVTTKPYRTHELITQIERYARPPGRPLAEPPNENLAP